MDYTKLSAVGMPAAPARKSATKRVTDSKRPMRRVKDSKDLNFNMMKSFSEKFFSEAAPGYTLVFTFETDGGDKEVEATSAGSFNYLGRKITEDRLPAFFDEHMMMSMKEGKVYVAGPTVPADSTVEEFISLSNSDGVKDSARPSLRNKKVSDTMTKLRRARMIRKKVQDALADTESTEDAQVAALGCVGPDCSAEEVIASVVDILGDVIDRIEGEGDEEPAEEAPVEDSLKRKAAFRRTLKRVKDALEETEDTEGAIDAALDCIDANTPATDVLEAVITVLGSAIDDLSGEGDEEPIDEGDEEPIDEDMPEIEDCGATPAKDSARRKSVPARARRADSKTPKKTQIKKATPKKNTKK